jgi:hypothetical protein
VYNALSEPEGADNMLTRITERELITTSDAKKKYRTKYINMHITEQVDITGQRDKGYVLYVADKRKELLAVPREEYKDKIVARLMGDSAPELASLGDLVHYE